MDNEIIYKLWLALLCPGLRLAVPAKLSEYFGSARGVYEAEVHELLLCGLLNEKELDEIRLAQKRGLPYDRKERWDVQGIRFICIDDDGYPAGLRDIADPPYALWYRGELPGAGQLCVGIIGARSCSDYGRRSAEYFGRELAKAGVDVISGMAAGIDGLSQAACLEAGGKSYGILGSGPDVIYPRSNGRLYQDLIKNGGVISEYIPGTAAIASNFPRRNRIISALSDVLLVIEAREKSGTFITVNFALEQGCDVYALPGRIDDPLSAGCNRLIREGAGVACSVEDVLFGLGNVHKIDEKRKITGNGGEVEVCTRKYAEYRGDDPVQAKVLEKLKYDPLDIEYLLRMINSDSKNGTLSIQELASALMQLEMEGVIANRGGCYFIL